MQSVSSTFKTAMALPIRDRGHAKIDFSLINDAAQTDADVSSNQLTYYSNTSELFNPESSGTSRAFATLEQDFCLPSASMFFLPRESIGTTYAYNTVSEAMVGSDPVSMVITFDTPQTFKGLTIDFGDRFSPAPQDFTVTTNTGISVSVTDNLDQKYFCNETFTNVSTITITASRMLSGAMRLRFQRIVFGTKLTFDNDDIISLSITDREDPLSMEGQSRSAVIEISNWDHRYDIENPDSIVAFIRSNQLLKIAFGIEGIYTSMPTAVYWVASTTLAVESATVTETVLTITAKGLDEVMYLDEFNPIQPNDAIYYYYVNLIAPVTVDYNAMKSLTTTRIPPVHTSKRDALKMIANACGAVYYFNRSGAARISMSPMLRDNTDSFTYTVDEMMSLPHVEKPKRIKDITVKYYPQTYASASYTEIVDIGEVAATSGDVVRIWHEDKVYRPAVGNQIKDENGTVIGTCSDAYAYYFDITFSQTGAFHAYAQGCKIWEWGDESYTLTLNDDGESITWDNPLIDKLTDAQALAQRIADYYSVFCEYAFDSRGELQIDAGDVVLQENSYTGNERVCITEITTSFNGAFHGNVKSRRMG